jgi:7-cyano-7-deazaguanine synthase
VLALTVDYGQRAAERETASARAICARLDVPHERLDLRWLGALGGSALTSGSAMPHPANDQLDSLEVTRESAKAVWVPNRNGVLINAAAAIAERRGAERVVVGFNSEEAATFPDNSEAFLEAATAALRFSTANGVRVHCYTAAWDKRRIVAELAGAMPEFPFELVWSCYEGGERACGSCESCKRLARALGGKRLARALGARK